MDNKNNKSNPTVFQGGTGRRHFLKLSAMAGIVGAVCATDMPLDSWVSQPTPDQSDALRLGLAGKSFYGFLDPGRWSSLRTFAGFSAVYSALAEIDLTGTLNNFRYS